MCIAHINVTLQPCSHRWYSLARSCKPSSNLANCPDKLKLEGWETRRQECPWCSSATSDVNDSTHRLFGSTSRRRSDSSTGSFPDGTSRSRANSGSTSTSLSRSSSIGSGGAKADPSRAERNRMMNMRLQAYMMMDPGKVFKGGLEEREKERSSDEDVASEGSVTRSNSVLGKGWKKSKKLSMGIFKP